MFRIQTVSILLFPLFSRLSGLRTQGIDDTGGVRSKIFGCRRAGKPRPYGHRAYINNKLINNGI
ncbi:MAG: hypothetical protein LBP50_00135 [Tannerella sp.]|nr:hypothetical protein [Tannerella sp.]